MAQTVWKYQFEIGRDVVVAMPVGAQTLHIGMQDLLTMWAQVDPYQELEVSRRFIVIGTGHMLPEGGSWVYRGTAQDGGFVWHLFEDVLYQGVGAHGY